MKISRRNVVEGAVAVVVLAGIVVLRRAAAPHVQLIVLGVLLVLSFGMLLVREVRQRRRRVTRGVVDPPDA